MLHVVFAVWFGGREGVSHAYATNPTEVFIVARVTAAVLGTVAVGLLYLAGARLFDRRIGLLAAALLAVSFLPVFYSHLALNDVPTLAPIASRCGARRGVLRGGGLRDYVVAGVGLGLACATKYTGGIVLLPLLAAAAAQGFAPRRCPALRGWPARSSIAGVRRRQPVRVPRLRRVPPGPRHQTQAADDALGKLGLTQDNGVRYYLWTFTWGMGWVPLIAAHRRRRPARAARRAAADRRARAGADPVRALHGLAGALLRPLAAAGLPDASRCSPPTWCSSSPTSLGERRPALRLTLSRSARSLLCGQGLVYSLHIGQVLSRADTRNIARDWMVAHVPAHSRRSSSSRSCPTAGRRTSATRRGRPPTATAGSSSRRAAR